MGGAPVALLHGQGGAAGLSIVEGHGAGVVLRVPYGIAQGAAAVPGEPPVEHLRCDAGHGRMIRNEAGAVLQHAVAGLYRQVAGQKQVVAVVDVQRAAGIAGALGQQRQLFRRDRGRLPVVILADRQGLLLRGDGDFPSHTVKPPLLRCIYCKNRAKS